MRKAIILQTGMDNTGLNAGLKENEISVNASLARQLKAFVRAKRCEWDDYRIHVTDWEIERYLENA